VPAPGSLLLDGLSISLDKMGELLRVEANDWVEEQQAIGQFFATLGNRLPDAMRHQHLALAERLTTDPLYGPGEVVLPTTFARFS
jgi:phosphoenolpyruvate carboxykinase (GTP)